MKIKAPNVELLQQEPGLFGIYRQIELAGRTCYKSEDKITDDSAKGFVTRMLNSGHTSMLEHGTVYLQMLQHQCTTKLADNPYTHVNYYDGRAYVTTNFRVIVENDLLLFMKYLCEATPNHEKRVTFRITTNIGVTRELNRHRCHSIAEESTRYCNYTKDKFGSEITYCLPSWISDDEVTAISDNDSSDVLSYLVEILDSADAPYVKPWEWVAISQAIANLAYSNLIKSGKTPQEARCVLPLMTKSDIVHTAFLSDWLTFIKLRLLGTTGKPHPDMKVVAELIKNELINKDIWDGNTASLHI